MNYRTNELPYFPSLRPPSVFRRIFTQA